MTQSTSINPIDLFTNTIDKAIELVKADGFDLIHCSLTGVACGSINEDELRIILQMEIQKAPMASADELVDSFALRHYAMSSRPAPSLRLHKDHSTLLRLMRTQPQGMNRVFAFLTGKLLFDSMLPEKERAGSMNQMARLHFLIALHPLLSDLLPNWSQSLTMDDEETKVSDSSIAILREASGQGPSRLEESKAAQRALESLLRLDAIHSMRFALYNEKLKSKLLALREANQFTFSAFADLLRQLEDDSVVRLQKQKPTIAANAMSLTAALESISWTQKRITALAAKYESKAGHGATRKGEKQLDEIFQFIGQLGVKDGVIKRLNKADKQQLQKKLDRLSLELDVKTQGEKRVTLLKSVYSAAGESKGTVKVRRGSIHTLTGLVEAGVKLSPAMQAKLDSAVKAGKAKKPKGKKAQAKATVRSQAKSMFSNMFASTTLAGFESEATEEEAK